MSDEFYTNVARGTFMTQPTSASLCIRTNTSIRTILRSCAISENMTMQCLMKTMIAEGLVARGYKVEIPDRHEYNRALVAKFDKIAAMRKFGKMKPSPGRTKRRPFGK